MQDDALSLIFERNQFYKKKYHLVLGVYILSIPVIFFLVGMLYYLVKHPTQPIYFVADEVGRLIEETPLTQPNMSLDDVAAYVTDAIQSAYSYDYVNYRAELQSAQKFFTPYGWFKYMEGLNASTNLVALTERKMVFMAKVVNTPRLVREGLMSDGHIYGYKFEVPVLVTYMTPPYDDKSRFQNPLMITITVRRLPLLESYKGLGVIQMNASQVLSTT